MNKHMQNSIEVKDITTETVIEHLCLGVDIIFATDQGRLVGAMTDGDINRCIRDRRGRIDSSIINHKINRIIKKDNADERLIEIEAEEIFARYPKIHNIPVVDGQGRLLYQIDRNKNKEMSAKIRKCLDVIRVNKSIDILLDSYKSNCICLTGGMHNILKQVKAFLEKELRHSETFSKGVDIIISAEPEEIKNLDKNVLVICLLNSLAGLLKMSPFVEVPVCSLEMTAQYYWYKELEQIRTETFGDFCELFGYDEIEVQENNSYIGDIAEKISKHGVSVNRNKEVATDALGGINIFAYSASKKYMERVTLERFCNMLKWLQSYRYITLKPLTREIYIQEYIAWLETIKNEGFEGVLIKEYNLLDCEVYQTVQEWGKGKFVIKRPEDDDSKEFVLLNVTRDSGGVSFYMDMQSYCIMCAVNNACCNLARCYCNNVYVHSTFWKDSPRYVSYARPGRGILNYINHDEDFPTDFIEGIYGRNGYPAEQVIEDSLGCEKVCIQDNYIKYQSNYRSKYFNTDSFGNRITTNMPEKYTGTIYLLGACLYTGYAVPDEDTVASLIQKRINASGKKYRVVNLGGAGIPLEGQIGKLCDRKIGAHDIVVCWASIWNRLKENDVITVDIEEMASELGEEEYWDDLLHCGKKGYEIVAKQIYEKIEPKLLWLPDSHFHLHGSMEQEIISFLSDIKNQISQRTGHILHDTSRKSGAIVMNCNPFTYGHKYLIETASRLVDILYIFVVEEDKSVFPFADRIQMVQEGTKDFANVVVLPSGKFMISSVTFPGYFTKGSSGKKYYDSFLDLKIFAHYIAPSLGISLRFVGEEPFDQVTSQYNCDMKLILEEQGITVIEIPRKKLENEVISATRVRSLMEAGEYSLLQKLVPDSTFQCIQHIVR